MRRFRIIPTLLLDRASGLVKTVKFGRRTYIGDPINAVKIFNEKGVDELILLDIDATVDRREPNYGLIEEIASEAFMPVGYGGGIRDVDQMKRLLRCGLEKVIVSTLAEDDPDTLRRASSEFGSQSVVVCLDVKKGLFGSSVVTSAGQKKSRLSPLAAAQRATEAGAGEIIVQSVDRDGTFSGYDEELVGSIARSVDVPVVALGGARRLDDIYSVISKSGCSAAAAGSMFVYQGTERGVLISYPTEAQLNDLYRQLNP
jgi:cyclase